MELPKNITQIGDANQSCKIYVEDYVISYIKQMNANAMDKEIGIGLFGVRKDEAGIEYLFFYGACKLNFLQKEARHLSQAVLQEAEKVRKKYFEEYTFLGYRMLNGEMVEGIHVYEQGTGRYISGYARFYEKNDSMLHFLVAEREEVKPEQVNREKYEMVKRRQDERRQSTIGQAGRKTLAESSTANKNKYNLAQLQRMKLAAVSLFFLFCVAWLASVVGEEKLDNLQVAAKQMLSDMTQKQLPDETDRGNTAEAIVVEDNLAEALRRENENSIPDEAETLVQEGDVIPVQGEVVQLPPPETGTVNEPVNEPVESVTVPEKEETTEPTGGEEVQAGSANVAPTPVYYTVKRGDTLMEICIEQYGSVRRMKEVCALNDIDNPDNIKIGEKILLPQ